MLASELRKRKDAILKILEYKPDCLATNKKGEGPLHLAFTQCGCTPILIDALLQAGADPNLRNFSGQTTMHVIDRNGSEFGVLIDSLIQHGADIDEKDGNGATLLFRAVSECSKDGKELVDAFLDRGAVMAVRDFKGRTLLHNAVWKSTYHDTKMFEILLGRGLDLHAVGFGENTILHELATLPGYGCLSRWLQLMFMGLDPMNLNSRGWTPLHIVCSRATKLPPLKERTPIDYLISVTENINVKERDRITLLHLASTTSEWVVKKLLSAGVDPTVSTFEGVTPLHLASRTRQSNTVGMLLDAIQRLELARRSMLRAKAKWTPLSYACQAGIPETVALLLDAGAAIHSHIDLTACSKFEEEQKLWNVERHEADTEKNGEAGGLTLQDRSRPNSALTCQHDTTRLEEILDMLIGRDIDLTILEERGKPNIYEIIDDPLGYTSRCLRRALDAQEENHPERMVTKQVLPFPRSICEYQQEAAIQAIRQRGQPQKTPLDSNTFTTLMNRRD